MAAVISKNLARRHLNEAQRAMVAESLANMKVGDFAGNQHVASANLQTPKVSQADAAKKLNVSPRSVATARVVKQTALERGMHALHAIEKEIQPHVKAYAANVGRARTTVQDEVKAARVADAVTDIRHDLTGKFAPLVEIHAAPRWLWPALVEKRVGLGMGECGDFGMVGKPKNFAPARSFKRATDKCCIGTCLERRPVPIVPFDKRLALAVAAFAIGPAKQNATQEAEAIFRRKAIYEELHPETRATKEGGAFRGNQFTDNLSVTASFAAETAQSTGKDERTIRRAAARGEALGDDLADVAGTSLDKGVELDALAKMAPADQFSAKPIAARSRETILALPFSRSATRFMAVATKNIEQISASSRSRPSATSCLRCSRTARAKEPMT